MVRQLCISVGNTADRYRNVGLNGSEPQKLAELSDASDIYGAVQYCGDYLESGAHYHRPDCLDCSAERLCNIAARNGDYRRQKGTRGTEKTFSYIMYHKTGE